MSNDIEYINGEPTPLDHVKAWLSLGCTMRLDSRGSRKLRRYMNKWVIDSYRGWPKIVSKEYYIGTAEFKMIGLNNDEPFDVVYWRANRYYAFMSYMKFRVNGKEQRFDDLKPPFILMAIIAKLEKQP